MQRLSDRSIEPHRLRSPDQVADIDGDAHLQLAVLRNGRIARGHGPLIFASMLYRVYGARKRRGMYVCRAQSTIGSVWLCATNALTHSGGVMLYER